MSRSTEMLSDQGDLIDLLQDAWSVIANVDEGNQTAQTAEWQEAAKAWRDEFHRRT